MSAGGHIVVDWAAVQPTPRQIAALENRLAVMDGVDAMSSAVSEVAHFQVVLGEGADADAILAAIHDAEPGAMAEWQRPTGFGDSPALSAWLLDLIRSGAKTATCGALRNYEADGDLVPQPGWAMLALDWDGRPALVYRVDDVQILPFDQVPEDFALAEGEGSFADWRAAHQAFFARNGGFAPDMPVVCERFHMMRDLA